VEATEDQAYLAKRSDWVSGFLVALHLSFALTPVLLAARLGPSPILILLCLWSGASLHGLLNLMHEAAHGHVFQGRRASFGLGQWALAPLVVTDFNAYRKRHWQHHRELGTENDTKFTYKMNLSYGALMWFGFKCLFLLEALGKFRHVSAVDRDEAVVPKSGSKIPRWLLRGAGVHLLIGLFAVAVAAQMHGPDFAAVMRNAALAYGFVFLYGLAAVTSFFTAIRSVAEHRPGLENDIPAGDAAMRNLKSNRVSRLILSGYGFAEHATHHERPNVPAYHLPKLTRELALEDSRFTARRGYLETCWLLIRGKC
jgi:fatty acid desaturase